jgi:hypothetical protein
MTTLSIINESKQIYLSSVENELNTTLENGDYKSKIRFTIPYLVTTNDNTLYQTIKVLNATIPYSFYIINEYNCNLNMNNIILNIPFGNYNAYTLLDTINSLMTENNILGTLTLDISNGKYLLTATQNIIIRTTTNNINSIIGLDNSTYTTINNGTNFKIYFPYPVNTGGIHNIFIKSNFSTSNQKYGGNNTSQILTSIPIQVEPFGIIQYSNYENTETIIRNKDLDSLIIELLDDNLNHINFNGLNWTIGLEIKSVNKFNPNDTNIFSWE